MKKKKFTVDKMTFVAFTIIPLILYTFFYFISVSCGIYYSLTDWNGLNREYNFVGIANYIALSKNVFMWRSLWRTLLYACMLVVCVTVLSLIIALVLNSVKKCRVFVKSVFFFPAMLGSVAVALIWDQMFYQLLPAVGKMMQEMYMTVTLTIITGKICIRIYPCGGKWRRTHQKNDL